MELPPRERLAMNLKRIGLLALFALVIGLMAPAYVSAQGPPPVPHAFYGTLLINDADAPPGTVVEARGEGVIKSSNNPIVTSVAGRYGGPAWSDPKLAVQGDITDGATITFWVQRPTDLTPHQADQTAEWHSMGITELNLTATITAPPLPPGGGGGGLPPTYDEIEGILFGTASTFRIGADCSLIDRIRATSDDGNLTFTIPAGTILRDEDEDCLEELQIEVDEDPECPPLEDEHIIGLPYSFEPSGATFDPAFEVIWSYDEVDIPEGVAEEDLRLAYCDEDIGEWVVIDEPPDIEDNEITFDMEHFTTYAIIAFTVPPEPAAFTPSSLTISPSEVDIDETVNISISVANTGGQAGSYTVTLKIDGVVEEAKEVTVAAGASTGVAFTTSQGEAGTYSVDVNGLTGSFTVMEEVVPLPPTFTPSSLRVSPDQADIGETVTISISVANTGGEAGSYTVTLKIDGVVEETKEVTVDAGASTGVNFTTSRDEAGTYSVDVNGLTGSFTVKEEVIPPPPTNWPLIGGIIGGVIVVGLLIYFFAFRRRGY